jgi:enterochelin esterase-like enzyme
MWRVFCGLLAAWPLLVGGLADAGDIRRESVASSSLGRDLPYLIYVPDGYAPAERHYPALYLLHGAGGNETTWSQGGQLRETVDRLIAKGAIPPTLIVMPGCPECWWIDGARDKTETAFWSELEPTIDARYATIRTRDGRLIAGQSAGGYGAVRFAMRYPDRIAAIAALSPAVYAETPPPISAARTMPPFRGPDGRFDQGAWSAQNYPRLIDGYLGQRQRVAADLFSGNRDRYGIASETALLFKRLSAHQPDAVTLRIVEGDHDWSLWVSALDDALPYIYRFAARPQVASRPAEAAAPLLVRRK